MKKRIGQMAAIGFAVMLLLTGCAKNELKDVVVSTPEEIVEVTDVEESAEVEETVEEVVEETLPLRVNIKTNHKTYYFEGGEEAYLYLQYCDVEVEGDEYTNLKRNIENWSMERSEGLRSLYASLEETAAIEADTEDEFFAYNLYQYLTTARVDARVVSLRDDTYQFTGGIDNAFYREGVNFDSQTGKKLELRDVISDWENFSKEAEACIVYHLKENYGETLFEDYAATIENIWKSEADLDWYFDGSSIVIVVQEYMVGPESIRTPEIHLPYIEFEQYIKEAYLPVTENGVALFDENQEIHLKLPGVFEEVPMMLQYEWTDDVLNCSLWLGENEKTLEYFTTLEDAYLLRNEEEIYCFIEVDMASDDYVTNIYRLTDGVIEEVATVPAAVDGGNINPTEVVMESWVYLLGTYSGVKSYYFDDNGNFVTEDTEYEFPKNEFVLTTTIDLPVTLEDMESVLPAGSHIVLKASDGETYVKFTIQETDQTGILNVERNTTESHYVMIDGKNENGCFEMLPYAG